MYAAVICCKRVNASFTELNNDFVMTEILYIVRCLRLKTYNMSEAALPPSLAEIGKREAYCDG
jgi:hypothetical protein